jgi:hypothetical protein
MKINNITQIQWYIPVVLTVGRPKQENHKFEVSVGHIPSSGPAWAT